MFALIDRSLYLTLSHKPITNPIFSEPTSQCMNKKTHHDLPVLQHDLTPRINVLHKITIT